MRSGDEVAKNQEEVPGDMSLVFGAGATSLANELNEKQEAGLLEASPSCSKSDDSKKETSTPVRKKSRGRRRARNSGRSSPISPSPIRPQIQKPRLEATESFVDSNIGVKPGQDQGEAADLIDPGDTSTPVKNDTHDMSDSGDWGDTSVEDREGEIGSFQEVATKVSDLGKNEGEGTSEVKESIDVHLGEEKLPSNQYLYHPFFYFLYDSR